MTCSWCHEPLGPNTFATGPHVFCSGKCARYFATAPDGRELAAIERLIATGKSVVQEGERT